MRRVNFLFWIIQSVHYSSFLCPHKVYRFYVPKTHNQRIFVLNIIFSRGYREEEASDRIRCFADHTQRKGWSLLGIHCASGQLVQFCVHWVAIQRWIWPDNGDFRTGRSHWPNGAALFQVSIISNFFFFLSYFSSSPFFLLNLQRIV